MRGCLKSAGRAQRKVLGLRGVACCWRTGRPARLTPEERVLQHQPVPRPGRRLRRLQVPRPTPPLPPRQLPPRQLGCKGCCSFGQALQAPKALGGNGNLLCGHSCRLLCGLCCATLIFCARCPVLSRRRSVVRPMIAVVAAARGNTFMQRTRLPCLSGVPFLWNPWRRCGLGFLRTAQSCPSGSGSR